MQVWPLVLCAFPARLIQQAYAQISTCVSSAGQRDEPKGAERDMLVCKHWTVGHDRLDFLDCSLQA